MVYLLIAYSRVDYLTHSLKAAVLVVMSLESAKKEITLDVNYPNE